MGIAGCSWCISLSLRATFSAFRRCFCSHRCIDSSSQSSSFPSRCPLEDFLDFFPWRSSAFDASSISKRDFLLWDIGADFPSAFPPAPASLKRFLGASAAVDSRRPLPFPVVIPSILVSSSPQKSCAGGATSAVGSEITGADFPIFDLCKGFECLFLLDRVISDHVVDSLP